MANHPIRTRAAREIAQGAKQCVTNNLLRETTTGSPCSPRKLQSTASPVLPLISLGDGESKNLRQTVKGSIMAASPRAFIGHFLSTNARRKAGDSAILQKKIPVSGN